MITQEHNAMRDFTFEKLNYLKSRITDILADKCMFAIPADRVADLADDDDAPCPGYYSPKYNTVFVYTPAKGLLEKDYIGILSHEYVHCWQHANSDQFNVGKLAYYDMDNIENENNIPYAGKLIIEGCANWGQYKVLDYFGLDQMIEALKKDAPSIGGHPDFNEYDMGFRLMLHLEYHCDFARLLHFLATGDITYYMDPSRSEQKNLTSARDYEQFLYPNPRLSIDNTLGKVKGYEGQKRLDQKTYEKICGQYRTGNRLSADFPRTTYISFRVHKNGASPPLSLPGNHPAAVMGLINPEFTLAKLLEKYPGIRGELEKKGFWLLNHELKAKLSVLDVCHLNSSADQGRSTTELLGFIATCIKNLEDKKSGPKKK